MKNHSHVLGAARVLPERKESRQEQRTRLTDFSDVLQRHVTNHDSEGSNKRQKVASTSRARASRACIACAESKLKCEGGEPCQRCQARGTACRYKSPAKRLSTATARRDDGPINSSQSKTQTSLPSEEASREPSQQPRLQDPPEVSQQVPQTMSNQADLNDISLSLLNDYQNNAHLSVAPQAQVLTNRPDEAMMDNVPSIEATTSIADYTDTGLADFLRDIMMPDAISGDMLPEMRHDFFFSPKDVLDFGVDTSLAWQGILDMPQLPEIAQQDTSYHDSGAAGVRFEDTSRNTAARSGYATPVPKNSLTMSAQAFKESLWSFVPATGDHGKSHQFNLTMPMDSLVSSTRSSGMSAPCPALSQRARDGILACVLGTCDAAVVPRIVSSFPSAELMTNLIHNWIIHHKRQRDAWFHLESFDPNKQSAELLVAMIAAGASISNFPAVRRLGYAFQEAARAANERLFESDNRNIRSLRPMQGLTLTLDVGLWSGDRRRMEIAESFAQCIVTMMRRGGHFRQPSTLSTPTMDDDIHTLERKWTAWIEAESIKRLVAHLLIRDAETSISVLSPPLMSPAELTISPPSSPDLWNARTASEWRDRFMPRHDAFVAKWPSLRDCVDDVSLISTVQDVVDVQFCIQIILCGMWSFAWHYRQLAAASKSSLSSNGQQRNSVLTLNLIQQETAHRLEHFSVCASEWDDLLPGPRILYQRQLMSLYVSLEDLQLLAGKAGEDEARKAYPLLSQWAQDRDSRQACWHAGQILKTARELSGPELLGVSAVVVYHASIVLWAHSILTNNHNKLGEDPKKLMQICLDQEENPHTQRWLVLGRGIPVITSEPDEKGQVTSIPLKNARRVMGVIIQLLRSKNPDFGDGECPPLVENLNKLMRTLGNAAKGMHRMQDQG